MLPPTLAIPLSPHSPEPVVIPFVLIPACPSGFLMGSRGGQPNEQPRHRVVIPRPFYLGKFPVTQEQFACFQPEHRNQFHGMPNHPAELISWHDAQAFINWLNGLQTLPANHIARLPCEAEWEYACRAGTETEYYSGDGEAALKEAGWYDGNSDDNTRSLGKCLQISMEFVACRVISGNGARLCWLREPLRYVAMAGSCGRREKSINAVHSPQSFQEK